MYFFLLLVFPSSSRSISGSDNGCGDSPLRKQGNGGSGPMTNHIDWTGLPSMCGRDFLFNFFS